MGFANFMFSGSYSHLGDVTYNKQDRRVVAALRVYRTSAKVELVSEVIYNMNGAEQLPTVLSKGLTVPPAAPADEATYIVGSGATGYWAGKDGKIAIWKQGAWSFFDGGSQVYRNLGDSKYYKWSDGAVWTEVSVFDSVSWDASFEVADLSVSGNNILKAVYEYLKTRPEFAGASDA